MTAKIEYKGYDITFGENSEEWYCSDANSSSKSLKAVKRKIDMLSRAHQRENAIDAINIYTGVSCKIVEADKPTKWGHHVSWVAPDETGKNKRKKDNISGFAKDLPEIRSMIAERDRLAKISREAGQAVMAFEKTIPRLSSDDLTNLGSSDAD